MNTIFKVLWNQTMQTFVVTSELAKSKGKSSTKTKTDKRSSLIKLTNIALFSIYSILSGQALAAEKTQTTVSFCVEGKFTGSNKSCAEFTAPLKDTKYNSEVHLATPSSSVELGKGSNTAQKSGAIAIGQSANGAAWGGVAIGWGAELNAATTQNGSVNPDESVAVGYKAAVTGRDGSAFGGQAKAVEKSVAIGSKAQAIAKQAIALGRDSISSHENAIALGAGAKTAAPISTSSANINGIQYNNFAGSTAHSTLSIGSDSIKRTLTNLAAGRIAPDSTDAINGSQMFSIAKKLQDDKANKSQAYTFTIQNRASSLNNRQGNADRWTLAADDSLSFGATTALSVTTDSAGKIVYDLSDETKQNITKAKTTVQSGKNTTVTSKTNQNGSTNYIINAESPFEYVTENGDKLVLVDGQLYPEDQLNTDGSLKTNARAYTGKTKIHARNNGNAKQVVSNLASGRILNESDDAVTGNQLFNYVNVNGTAATTNSKVNFVNGTNTIVTNENGNISYKVANTTLSVTNIGALTLGNSAQGSYFVTANDMIQAINNSGWRIKASADGGSSSGGKEHLVKPSGLVELVAGNNIDITQADGKFTISTTAPKNGKDGVTLTSIDKQDGVTTIRFSDGKSFEVRDGAKGDKGDPGVAGAKGDKGADGKNGDSVKATVQNDGSVKYEIIDGIDNSVKNTQVVKNGEKGERGEKGETGAKGDKGADGKNGDSVKATVQNDGSVKYEIIDGTDNSVKNTQVVKNGEKGERGETGAKGDKGADGKNGDSVKATVQNDGSVKYEIIDGIDNSVKNTQVVKNGEKGERGEKGETGAKGDKGADGKNGDSVKATVQNDGSVKYEIIDGTDSSVKNTQVVKNGEKGERGEKGADGKNGDSVKATVQNDGSVKYEIIDGTDNSVKNTQVVKNGEKGERGEKGAKGDKGADGKNGDSVKATVQNDGSVKYEIIDGTDSSVKNTQVVKNGEKGERGETGAKGDKGADGKNGDSVKATVQNDGSVKYEIIDGIDNSVKNTQVVKNGEKGERGDKGNDGTGGSGGTPQDSISEENVIAGNNIHVSEKKDTNRTGKDFIVSLNDQITLGQKEDGSLEIKNTGDNTRIAIRNGTISITTADGKNAVITVDQGASTVSERDSDKQGIERITYVSKDPSGKPTKRELATMDDGLVFAGDSGENSKNTLGSTLTISGGETAHTKLTNKPNIGVHSNGKGKLSVKLAKNIDLTKEGSLTIGDTTVNNTGVTIKNGPSITKSGVNAGGKRITNVAPGVNGTDAVNVDQLNKVNAQARAGIASASAMANLPQVYQPGKSAVMAAAANHRGESAYAIGYSRISDNGKWIIRLASSGNTQNDFTIGGGAGYVW